MIKDEALNLALRALERLACLGNGVMRGNSIGNQIAIDALTAIKEALAQPKQDGKCKYCTDGCPACDARKLPEQEPVAWMNDSTPSGIFARHMEGAKNFGCTIPLYTTPLQRTWVGLTDEDDIDWEGGGNLKDLVKAIEGKLKEKNG